jgi:hypothetical protein
VLDECQYGVVEIGQGLWVLHALRHAVFSVRMHLRYATFDADDVVCFLKSIGNLKRIIKTHGRTNCSQINHKGMGSAKKTIQPKKQQNKTNNSTLMKIKCYYHEFNFFHACVLVNKLVKREPHAK